jgi:hypothetical protein
MNTPTVVLTTDLAPGVITYDLSKLRALHPKLTIPPFHPLSEVSTQPTLTKLHWVLLLLHRKNEVHPSNHALPLLP